MATGLCTPDPPSVTELSQMDLSPGDKSICPRGEKPVYPRGQTRLVPGGRVPGRPRRRIGRLPDEKTSPHPRGQVFSAPQTIRPKAAPECPAPPVE